MGVEGITGFKWTEASEAEKTNFICRLLFMESPVILSGREAEGLEMTIDAGAMRQVAELMEGDRPMAKGQTITIEMSACMRMEMRALCLAAGFLPEVASRLRQIQQMPPTSAERSMAIEELRKETWTHANQVGEWVMKADLNAQAFQVMREGSGPDSLRLIEKTIGLKEGTLAYARDKQPAPVKRPKGPWWRRWIWQRVMQVKIAVLDVSIGMTGTAQERMAWAEERDRLREKVKAG